jgi:hypothetical protein
MDTMAVRPRPFPTTLECELCGGEMKCIEHESQEIADQVVRTYECHTCPRRVRKAISVFRDDWPEEWAAAFLI